MDETPLNKQHNFLFLMNLWAETDNSTFMSFQCKIYLVSQRLVFSDCSCFIEAQSIKIRAV